MASSYTATTREDGVDWTGDGERKRRKRNNKKPVPHLTVMLAFIKLHLCIIFFYSVSLSPWARDHRLMIFPMLTCSFSNFFFFFLFLLFFKVKLYSGLSTHLSRYTESERERVTRQIMCVLRCVIKKEREKERLWCMTQSKWYSRQVDPIVVQGNVVHVSTGFFEIVVFSLALQVFEWNFSLYWGDLELYVDLIQLLTGQVLLIVPSIHVDVLV